MDLVERGHRDNAGGGSNSRGHVASCALHCPLRITPEDQWEFMLAALQLLPLAAAHLKLVFAREGRMDFAEYAQRALDAIGADGEPTELALQLGYRIRHVLVDEFQDTNVTQIQLLERLLETWEADEDCSTFYVGDPMQSIYAFRRADVSIFQRLKHEKHLGEQCASLRANCGRTSARRLRLVEWFNQVFPHILNNESALTNAVAYPEEGAVASREAAEGEAVTVRGFATEEREAEAEWVAGQVRDEVERLEAEEEKARAAGKAIKEKPALVAVLVRSRSHLPLLRRRCARPEFAIARSRPTGSSSAGWCAIWKTYGGRCAIRPTARHGSAYYGLLGVDWNLLTFGGCAAAWVKMRSNSASLRCANCSAMRRTELSDGARARLRRVLPVLDAALAECGKVGLREMLERCWLRLGGAACAAMEACKAEEVAQISEQVSRDADAYFTLLDAEGLAGGLADEDSFDRKLEDLYSPADTDPTIRVEVMPIHQAKGLEWDVVFLPALER